jgi:hypothetical protein
MSKISQQVMASVAVIYAARKASGPTALKLYTLMLSIWGIGKLVWVSKVFENFLVAGKSGMTALSNYLLVALEHAHISVQLTLAVFIIAGVWLLLDLARAAAPRSARFAA